MGNVKSKNQKGGITSYNYNERGGNGRLLSAIVKLFVGLIGLSAALITVLYYFNVIPESFDVF